MRRKNLVVFLLVPTLVVAGIVLFYYGNQVPTTVKATKLFFDDSPADGAVGGADGAGVSGRPHSRDLGAIRDRRPLPPILSPRELLSKAQQTGSAEDSLKAAKGIFVCRGLFNPGVKAREALGRSGESLSPTDASALMSPTDALERGCQELDNQMLAQYEPMILQAMRGGMKGAAALWWMSPESRSLKSVADAPMARDLLRRDALACDTRSLMAYQGTALRFAGEFDVVEVAAVRAASEELERQGKLRANKGFRQFTSLFLQSGSGRSAVDKDAVNSKATQILSSCK